MSCPSADRCVAVGRTADRTLAEHWDGNAWSVVATPTPKRVAYSSLADVACAKPRFCFAVGSSQTGKGNTVGVQLIERWDGRRWSIVQSPEPKGATSTHLYGVACASPHACFAVGTWYKANKIHTLIQRWDGTHWSLVLGLVPTGGAAPQLMAVTCATAISCEAVGDYDTADAVTTSSTTTGPVLTDGSGSRTLVEHWDGTRWSVVTSPTPPGSSFASLGAIECSNASSCIAVGGSVGVPEGTSTEQPASAGTTIVEHWDGSAWSIAASPTPPGATRGDSVGLSGIACANANSCVAVGGYGCCEHSTSFAELWDGSSWTIVPTPTLAGLSGLADVACVSTESCFAVGTAGPPDGRTVLIEHWDGNMWSVE